MQGGDGLSRRHIPAPSGENAVSPASAVPEGQGLVLLNVVGGDRGLKPRAGYSEQSINVGSGEVRSVIPYHGSTTAADRLFATASDKIYDCTTVGNAPTAKLTFGTANALSGYGIGCAFTNASGRYLAYCDETNGYHLYTEGTDTWAVGSTTGLTPGNAVFVTQFKSRLWFVNRDSSKAFYLGLGAISGAATEFDFGPIFPNGGYLIGLWAWTVDGGSGMDDLLVAASSSGDVVVYSGTDPASNFQQLGAWNLGGFPLGRRVATRQGGDILFISVLGVIALSKLVSGESITPDTYETAVERPRFAETIAAQKDTRGWDILQHPDNFLMVNTPGAVGVPQEQYAMSYSTKGWSRLRGLDILSCGVWQGKFFFGTRDGRVCKGSGYLDNVGYAGSVVNAKTIDAFVLGPFDTLGTGSQKQVHLIRSSFITRGVVPNCLALARYDYNTREESGSVPASPQSGAASLWDTGTWDNALWTDIFDTFSVVHGAEGAGAAVAIGIHLNTQDYCVLVGWDIAYEEGGML